MDFKLAWRNIWRHPRRSVLTMSAIAFASLLLVFMLSWQFGSYDTMINASVKIHTGHIQVQDQGYQQRRNIRKVVSYPDEIGNILKQIQGVRAYAPRAEAFSLISLQDRTYGTLIVGVDPERERKVSTIKEIMRRGDFLHEKDTNTALAGKLLARNLKAGIGDELVILGQGRDGSIAATSIVLRGIFSSGQDEFDRSVIYIPLDYFQEAYGMRGAVHRVVVVCDSLENVPVVKKKIDNAVSDKDSLVVLDWKELNPGLVQAIQMDLISGLIFYLILIVVVAFSILNTFLMAIFERTREFGVMMAVGMTPGRLIRLLLMESFGMTIIGVLLGTIGGALVTWYFQVHGIVIPGATELAREFGLPERMFPQLSFLSVSVGAGIVLVLTCLTAVYPALKVRSLRPTEALTLV